MHTVYIVPAWSNQAGQCRIVAREGFIEHPSRDYKEHPSSWTEVGSMNSRGELVCLSAIGEAFREIKCCEPLIGGMTFQIEGILTAKATH